jgi:hypothetical protein
MAARGRQTLLRVAAGALSLGLLILVPFAPASAGIFERIFGGLQHAFGAPAREPTNISAYADPLSEPRTNSLSPRADSISPRAEAGPASAFCVRTCDGHFFPVRAHPGMNSAEACHSFCPASQTRLYSGSGIDHAVAADGSRYADLDNAFVYRKQLVAGCTCNGRDAFGLAHIDVKSDPTLRPGDVVATRTGLEAFTGSKNNVAEFTPVDSYRGLSKNSREQLVQVKIMPANPGAPNATPVPLRADSARGDGRHSAQLSR